MRITLVVVGKIKENYFSMAIEEYQKRLSRYCKLEIIEVADEKTPDGASKAEEQKIKIREGERLLRVIREGKGKKEESYVIALAIKGKQLDSIAFSKKISELGVKGNSHIVFLIGGSLGLDMQVLDYADEQISFSNLTFPHQLMRVILLEQIYRAFRIANHEPYHK